MTAEPLTPKEAESLKAAFEDATKKMRVAAGLGMQLADDVHALSEANAAHREAIKELKRIQGRVARARNKQLEDIADFERDGLEFSGVVFKTE